MPTPASLEPTVAQRANRLASAYAHAIRTGEEPHRQRGLATFRRILSHLCGPDAPADQYDPELYDLALARFISRAGI